MTIINFNGIEKDNLTNNDLENLISLLNSNELAEFVEILTEIKEGCIAQSPFYSEEENLSENEIALRVYKKRFPDKYRNFI